MLLTAEQTINLVRPKEKLLTVKNFLYWYAYLFCKLALYLPILNLETVYTKGVIDAIF